MPDYKFLQEALTETTSSNRKLYSRTQALTGSEVIQNLTFSNVPLATSPFPPTNTQLSRNPSALIEVLPSPSIKLLASAVNLQREGSVSMFPGSYVPRVLCSLLCMRLGNIGPFFLKRVLCSLLFPKKGPMFPDMYVTGEHRTLF